MFTLKLLLKRSCWTFIFMALALPASARVCFLPDSTDCGEGDVDVPEVQITCATYGGYETEAACLEARTNKTAQTCTLNSGCYYPKCAYDSERKCKNENPDKNCLSQTVDGVKCWYSQLKTCFDQGYKSACSSDENSTPVNIEAFDGPCYKCTEKATCKQMKPGVYYGPNDTCPKYTDRKDAGVTGKDGVCSTCEPQACSAINTAYKSEAKKDTCGSNKEAKKVEGTDSAADGPCYTCADKPLDKCVDIEATPFLDIIEPTVTTVKASGEVKEVNATLECGINPKKAYKYEINIITDYDYINLPVERIKPVEYRYASGGYYYKTNIDGKNVCITDRLCTQYAKEGTYISAYEISTKDMSVKLDHKVYCCKTDDNFSGDSLSNLYSSCKEALPSFGESQHIDRYIDPVYVCDKGVKEGTKCKIGSYSCPKDYKLSGDNCVKKECPKGYVLTSDNGKDVCVNPTYTCPTDGKYKYKLSGDKCVCESDCTYEYTRIDFSDTHGDSAFSLHLYDSFQNRKQNTRGASYYWKGPGSFEQNYDYSGFQMYSKIDKNSKSCQKDNGVTAYETICPGTARVACKKKFVPNGCSSEQYVLSSLTVESMDFGDCGCDTSKGLYDTDKSCTDATSLKCTLFTSRWCYQTCESAGMYSTEDACTKAASKYTNCNFDGRCYAPNKIGWGIHYTHKVESMDTRTYDCTRKKHENGVSDYLTTSWNVSVYKKGDSSFAKDLDGKTYWNIDGHKGEVRYPAGEYRICFDYSYAAIANYIYPYYIHLAKRNGDACDYRWNDFDQQWHPDENNKEFCSDVNLNTISGSYSACMIATFEDNTEYYVEGSFNSVSGYSCKQQGYSPY